MVSAVATFEEAVVCLPFGAMSMVSTFDENGGKVRGLFRFYENLKSFEETQTRV